MAYDDLSDNPNPMAQGSPRIDLTGNTSGGFGGNPAGYYTNPATSSNGNPYSNGVDIYSEGSAYVAGGMTASIAAQPDVVSDTAPTYQEYMIDRGLDDQNIPDRLQR